MTGMSFDHHPRFPPLCAPARLSRRKDGALPKTTFPRPLCSSLAGCGHMVEFWSMRFGEGLLGGFLKREGPLEKRFALPFFFLPEAGARV